MDEPPRRTSTAAGVKETLSSLMIAFAMAFAFRGFVVEGFVIPTGSMAPTLMGAHMQMRSPYTGHEWAVGPWQTVVPGNPSSPALSIQGGPGQPPVAVHDPLTGGLDDGLEIEQRNVRLLSGDRIFVLKYLYSIFDPERFDVVVFKNPSDKATPYDNYIKRLVGLPGEQISLIDGDVFFRPTSAITSGESHAWAGGGWNIARKRERLQRASWQPVHDSRHEPLLPGVRYRSPWTQVGGGWGEAQAPRRRFAGGEALLRWDHDRWPITDFEPYNERSNLRPRLSTPGLDRSSQIPYFPNSDLRLAATVVPEGEDLRVQANLMARDHLFRGRIEPGRAVVEMAAAGAGEEGWVVLDERDLRPLRSGRAVEVEFWHVDQALWLFVDGRLVAGGREKGAYELGPLDRVLASTTISERQLLGAPMILTDGARYRAPRLAWRFEGSPATILRTEVQRDLYFQPTYFNRSARRPARGTHPSELPALGPDQFFVLGDNSAHSLDGRLWEDVNEWVDHALGGVETGVVPRELLIGRAFFVYLPAVRRSLWGLPVPNVGRMRFIW